MWQNKLIFKYLYLDKFRLFSEGEVSVEKELLHYKKTQRDTT